MSGNFLNEEEEVEEQNTEAEADAQNSPLFLNNVVIENVFKYLSGQDLLNCRLCCRTFNQVALLQSIMGKHFFIRFRSVFRPDHPVEKRTLDNFLNTVSTFPYRSPFCRQFEFSCAVLKFGKISRFMDFFGETMTSLSLISCIFETENTIHSILSCPALKRLQLVNTLSSADSRKLKECEISQIFASIKPLSELKILELTATVETNAISECSLTHLLQICPNLNSVQIKTSLLTFERFSTALSSEKSVILNKLSSIMLSDMDCSSPSFMSSWENLRAAKVHLPIIEIIGCNVTLDFIKFILSEFAHCLEKLKICGGTTNEILSYGLLCLKQPLRSLSHLTLPLSAINPGDGELISHKLPKLVQLNLVSSLRSTFKTIVNVESNEDCYENISESIINSKNKNRMNYLRIQSKIENEGQKTPCFFQAPAYQDVIMDRKEEFPKILTLFPQNNITHLNIYLKHVTSLYLDLIFETLQGHLTYLTISADFSDSFYPESWTGIPLSECSRLISSCTVNASNSVSNSSLSCPCESLRTSPYIGTLTKLKQLELENWTSSQSLNSRETINFIITHGIAHLRKLETLKLNGFSAVDSSVSKALLVQLNYCEIDGVQLTTL